jgi:hypothetical protein
MYVPDSKHQVQKEINFHRQQSCLEHTWQHEDIY